MDVRALPREPATSRRAPEGARCHPRRSLVFILFLLGLVAVVYGARPMWRPLLVRFYVSRLGDDAYFDFDRRTDDYLPWAAYHRSVTRLETLGGQAVEALVDVVDDRNARVRERALVALMRIGDRRAFVPAVRALVDDDRAVREAAMLAVRSFCGGAPPAAMATSVSDFLAGLDRPAGPAVESLLDKCLKDPNDDVRDAARWALERLQTKA